jgi:hypothetical protein
MVCLTAAVLVAGVVTAWRAKLFSRGPAVLMPETLVNPPSKEELMKEIGLIVDSLATTLESVQDLATANQSLAGIEKATDQVLALNLQRLPKNYQPDMMEDVKPMVFRLVRILKNLYKLPGVQAIVEPSVSPLLSRLQAFANVPVD